VSAETLGPKPASGVWGYVASSKSAALEIDASRSSMSGVVVGRVLAPVDGFVVATESVEGTAPAMQVGLSPVKKGESTDIVIPIMGVEAPTITVTLYADKGQKERFEFDPMKPTSSPDRPIFVDGKPVARTLTISQPEAPMGAGAAVLDVFDQPAAKSLNITHVVTAGPSWIVVYADNNGSPGKERGRLSIDATDAVGVTVPLSGRGGKFGEFVSLNTDRGKIGTFEYSRSSNATGTGPDSPYVIQGAELLRHVVLH
jgi:hypothetical protein